MAFILSGAASKLEKLNTGRTREWLANKQMGTTQTALLENYFDKGGYVPPHYHDTEELLVCLEGNGRIIIKDEQFDFPAGSTAIIPAMTVHEVQNAGDGVMRMLGFFPDAEPKTIWINE
ncbi:cupin domain-containing protein [Pontibacter sp. 172403-2]|uniref:cupin domain-containing protein n=1 Tax=Pontibacter rufus TaxID=2791028 RepID=UPI0018B00B19|nr:cupin domain-containing protein [Pontibacter sp. 172403-2]MBF9254067.1 cupin domain-containing protein [Pontibacter sp. 172403-2]